MDTSAIPWVGLLWLGVATILTALPQPQHGLARLTQTPLHLPAATLGTILVALNYGIPAALLGAVTATATAITLLLLAGSSLNRSTWYLTWVPLAIIPYTYWIDLAVGWATAAAVSIALLVTRGRAAAAHASALVGLESVGLDASRRTLTRPRPLTPTSLPRSGARWPVAPTLLTCLAAGVALRALI